VTIALPWLVALSGALLYGLAPGGKASELGRLMFGAGLLAALLRLSSRMLSFL
jgi:hypothetical protein